MANWTTYPITHGYITASQGGDTPHYADDLATPFHTPITALWSGTVKQADYAMWSGQPGGGEVFVQPDSGGPQYYMYHLDDLSVHPGQHVLAGQELGLSGGQNTGGDHPVSPMWSSGLHTHVGYFTGYKQTPIGSRPYGPDITPALSSGAFSSLGTGAIQPLDSISGTALSTFPGTNISLPSQADVINTSYRVLFIVVGLFLIGFGLWHFLGRPPIQLPQGTPFEEEAGEEPEAISSGETNPAERASQ